MKKSLTTIILFYAMHFSLAQELSFKSDNLFFDNETPYYVGGKSEIKFFNPDSSLIKAEITLKVADNIEGNNAENLIITDTGQIRIGLLGDNTFLFAYKNGNSDTLIKVTFQTKNGGDPVDYLTIIKGEKEKPTEVGCLTQLLDKIGTNIYYFVPAVPDSSSEKNKGWPVFNDIVPDYTIALDLKSNQTSFTVFKEKIKKNRIYPQVGKTISISVRGSSKYDSVTFNGTPVSYNTEKGKDFMKFGAESEEGKESIATISDNKKIEILKKLILDYKAYYSYIRKFPPTDSELQIDKEYINSKLLCIGPESANSIALKKRLKELFAKDTLQQIEEVVYYYNLIMSFKHFSVVPQPVTNVDAIEMNFDLYKNGKKIESVSKTFYTSLGFKIDFSSGFIYSGLKDESYLIVDVPNNELTIDTAKAGGNIIRIDTLNKKVIKDETGNFKIGIALLSHFYTRFGPAVNIGGTTGFTINTTGDIEYLAGGSLMLGRNNRFVLSAGWSFGQVNEISSKYSLNEPTAERKFDNVNDSDLTTRKWDSSYFIGVTYNIASLGSEKKKMAANK